MEDIATPERTPDADNLPQANNDPDDPGNPSNDDPLLERTPPKADPTQDMDAVERQPGAPSDDEADPEDGESSKRADKDDDNDDDDDESDLSDIDEAQFQDFDADKINIEERPTAVDDENVKVIGKFKRKRAEGDGEKRKKKKEGRRSKKARRAEAGEEEFADGDDVSGKRTRKSRAAGEGGERRRRKSKTPENEELLAPEERRRRALDRAMDAALRGPNQRRRKMDGIDLEAAADEQLENMRRRMTDAAREDTEKRSAGQPAMEKLRMLPEVVALLNRSTLRDNIVDPDTNLLEAVRFFLEPLNDGSLPAFNIQRELFNALAKLPITKDTLVASGIGKVVLFYTKSTRPEGVIKRQAERLLSEWTRPILKRSDDYRKRELVQAEYDPSALPVRSAAANTAAAAAAARQRKLAVPLNQDRARMEGGRRSYNIAPRNSVAAHQAAQGAIQRKGALAEEQFRRMKNRATGAAKPAGRR